MKKLIYILIMTAFISSCSTDDDNDGNNLYYLNRHVEFKVSSQDGSDLLDPNNVNSYSANDIKIFNLLEGEVIEVNNGENSANPKGFKIVYPNDSGIDEYFIRVFIENPQLENAITYIEWNEADTDTIRSNSVANGNSLVLTKAWYNDEILIDENTESLPEIIKN